MLFASTYSQTTESVVSDLELTTDYAPDGSYQFIVDDLKAYQRTTPDYILKEIEERRDDNMDVTVSIDNYTVVIMSRAKWNSNIKWPKYQLIH